MAQNSAVSVSVESLATCFKQSLDVSGEVRRRAEAYLREASNLPNYGVLVLGILNSPSIDDAARHSAAVNFKNHVKYHWEPSLYEDLGPLTPIQESEKNQIKNGLLDMMLNSPPAVRSQIGESLAIVGEYDFPRKWPDLLPNIISRIPNSDYPLINGMLETANELFKRFRNAFKTDELYFDLKVCLDQFAEPMLILFKRTSEVITNEANITERLEQLLTCLRLICRIFFSLNSQELPAYFEDHMEEWMGEFHKYLQYSNPAFEHTKSDEPSMLDKLKGAICENINLYMEKGEEEFEKFLPIFVQDVWNLLVSIQPHPKHDQMTITALSFLTTVSKSRYCHLFSQPGILETICKSIIIPNIKFRDDYEELFYENSTEYIRRDIEGSDSDTPRRMACELVKELSQHFQQQVVQIISPDINALLAEYAANPSQNWRSKDTAIFLVIALAVRSKTLAAGATSTNELIDLPSFFVAHIVPELQSPDVNNNPVLKADVLKFVIMFRNQLSKQACMEVLFHIAKFLGAEDHVVHSYAATCIERLLSMKDDKKPRFGPGDLATITKPLIDSLLNVLEHSEENQYVMKCIMRLATIADVSALASDNVRKLSEILRKVCVNPKSPIFNHYLFESIAAFIQKAPSSEASSLESSLFPILDMVLQQDIAEFMPYMFQIMALLIEKRGSPLPDVYMNVFPPFISPLLWSKPANVPALVRLFQAYLEFGGVQIAALNQLNNVLGVFQKLISGKQTEQDGFLVLDAIIANLPLRLFESYLPGVWSVIFTRLQNSRTVRFSKCFLLCMAFLCYKHGVSVLEKSVEAVQPGLFFNVISVWIQALPSVLALNDHKLCVVASTRMLCESTTLQSSDIWAKFLDATLSLLERRSLDKGEREKRKEKKEAIEAEGVMEEVEELDLAEIAANASYGANYAKLHNAAKRDDDVAKEIQDLRQFVIGSLAQVCQKSPGKYVNFIQGSLDPLNKQAIAVLCENYKVTLV